MQSCEICSESARVFVRFADRVQDEPTTHGYCTDDHCQEDMTDGIYGVEHCDQCLQTVRLHDPAIDVRNAASAQFVTRADGTVVCRHCAGL